MRIPFTVEQFLAVFSRYNDAIWPAQIGAYALGGLVVWLALRGGGRPARAIPWLLAGAWAFVGVCYHLAFFAELNPAAWGFGAAFVLQAALFGWAALRRRLAFGWSRSLRAGVGLGLIFYAMVAYPLLGSAAGHAWPASPAFGVTPCPTTIFTFGVLLLSVGALPWSLLVLPGAWALVGTSAALQLGMREDLGLPVAAVLTVVLRAARPRRDRGPGPGAP